MIVFEDVDRSTLFSGDSNITMDCFLNILDGLDESYGRITIFTANDVEKIVSNRALVRPGRIDAIVKLGHCTLGQIEAILQFYFEDTRKSPLDAKDAIKQRLDPDIVVSPAQLTQLILIVNDPSKVVDILNKHKDMTNLDICTIAK